MAKSRSTATATDTCNKSTGKACHLSLSLKPLFLLGHMRWRACPTVSESSQNVMHSILLSVLLMNWSTEPYINIYQPSTSESPSHPQLQSGTLKVSDRTESEASTNIVMSQHIETICHSYHSRLPKRRNCNKIIQDPPTLQGDHDMICDGNVWNVWIMGQKMVHP